MEQLEADITLFVDEWEYYCYPDKVDKCKPQVELYLQALDRLLEETNDSKKKERAKIFYLKGKILDSLPFYEKSAQEFLNKSIKLNPSNGDCWNNLAHVLFKKKDIERSQKALEMAIQNKGKNKVSLRYQSVLLRTQGKTEEERRRNIEESLKIIKQALMLDIADGATWYFLGNAYFSNFISNFKKFDELENAVKAYKEAEKYFRHKYPDLFLNRANVEAHMEDYQSAVEHFKLTESIDPTLNCADMIRSIEERMEFTKTCFLRAKQLKKGKLEEIVKSIPNKISNTKEGLELCALTDLKQRYNPKKLLSAKIVSKITSKNDIPSTYLAVDHAGSFFTLSLYNANEKIDLKLKSEALITIRDPEFKSIRFGEFAYQALQVFEITKVAAEGHRLTKEEFNPNSVVNQVFEK